MAIVIEPATSSHDDAVRALFDEAQVPIHPEFWARAYDPAASADGPCRPFVATDTAGGIAGFFAIEPATLDVMGDRASIALVRDFVVAKEAPDDVPAMMLNDAMAGNDLTVVCGAGPRLAKLLALRSFLCAGHYLRAVAMPDDPASAVEPLALRTNPDVPTPLSAIDDAMAKERRIFRPRDERRLAGLFRGHARDFEFLEARDAESLLAYAVLRRVPGRTGDELHVVDFACRLIDAPRLAAALAQVARDRDTPVFASIFGDAWGEPLELGGFRHLKPRWPIHWILANPRLRVLGNSLLRRDAWHFTASDGAIDMW